MFWNWNITFCPYKETTNVCAVSARSSVQCGTAPCWSAALWKPKCVLSTMQGNFFYIKPFSQAGSKCNVETGRKEMERNSHPCRDSVTCKGEKKKLD